MMPEQRVEILRELGALSDLYPSWRFCQMVANVGVYAEVDSAAKLAALRDDEFAPAVIAAVQGRLRTLAGDRPTCYDDDTLPSRLPAILRGLEELGAIDPERPFVALVHQVAERAKEFAPFDFWDVEDADFLRAIQTHLALAETAR
jgi:hypothetical protein